MATTLEEATRLAQLGMAIVPIPHGHKEPRFDWRHYQRRAPSLRQIEAWLEYPVGIGAMCGTVSRNLVALEFTNSAAFLTWKQKNPGLAAKLPVIASYDTTYVLFKTGQPTPTGSLFQPGWEGRSGRILGEGSVIPLPPTLGNDGTPHTWVNGLAKENFPTFISIDEVNVSFRVQGTGSSGQGGTDGTDRTNGTDRTDGSGRDGQADRYAHVFQSSDSYRAEPEYQERKWVVEGFLPETYLAILAGTSKCGKSCLVTALAMAVARGEPFLGLKTAGKAVLWVAFEESQRERAEALDAYPGRQPNLYITHEKLYIDTAEGLDTLRWWIQFTDAKLVIIDPLYCATLAESLTDGRTARDSLAGLKELCRTERCAAVILHHFNKDSSAGVTRERFADSNQIVAAASMDILMDYREVSGGREITLRSRGRGEFTNQTWAISSAGVADYQLIAHGSGAEIEARCRAEGLLGTLREAAGPMTAVEIAHASGINASTVRNRLTELVRTGAVAVVDRVGKASAYGVGGR